MDRFFACRAHAVGWGRTQNFSLDFQPIRMYILTTNTIFLQLLILKKYQVYTYTYAGLVYWFQRDFNPRLGQGTPPPLFIAFLIIICV